MRFMTRIHRWKVMVGLVCFLAASNARVCAQEVSEYQVKAAYLYSFAKFIDWPAKDLQQPTFRMCVLNNKAFETTLAGIVKNKAVRGHPVNVMAVQNADEARNCHILFIGAVQNKNAGPLLESIKDRSVLTVGETTEFMEEGGMINFFLENDHVHFRVNQRVASQAGLHLSSRLLSVAKVVLK